MNKWSLQEEKYLKDNWGQATLKTIMKVLNRTEDSVVRKAQRLGLVVRKEPKEYLKKRWTDEEDKLLIEFYNIKAINELTAVLSSRTKESIIKRAKLLGLNCEKRQWTGDETTYLKEKWGLAAIEKIAKKLGRTKSAVLLKAHKIGLREQIIANGEYLTPKDISTILTVSTKTVYNWMNKGYLKYRKLKINSVKKYQISIENLIDFLKNHQEKWDTRTADVKYINVCCLTCRDKEHMNITEWLINKMEQDKKKKSVLYRKYWTVKEISSLKSMLKVGKSCKEIAVVLNRSFFSVQGKISSKNHEYLLGMDSAVINQ